MVETLDSFVGCADYMQPLTHSSLPWLLPSFMLKLSIFTHHEDEEEDICGSAGVLLYVIMAGNLPFDELSLPCLFKKIARADYPTPAWFTPDMTSLFKAMLNPNVHKR